MSGVRTIVANLFSLGIKLEFSVHGTCVWMAKSSRGRIQHIIFFIELGSNLPNDFALYSIRLLRA
jgi:hypothetical protein